MCAPISIRSERRQDGCKLFEAFDADLRQPQRHAGAIPFVEHPVRQLAAKIRPLVGVDARQILAAPERRHPQRPPEQRVPGIGDPRSAKSVSRMSIAGPCGRERRRPPRSTGPAAAPPVPSPPGRRSPCACRSHRRRDRPGRRCPALSCRLQRLHQAAQRGVDVGIDPQAPAADQRHLHGLRAPSRPRSRRRRRSIAHLDRQEGDRRLRLRRAVTK